MQRYSDCYVELKTHPHQHIILWGFYVVATSAFLTVVWLGGAFRSVPSWESIVSRSVPGIISSEIHLVCF